jgi:hypothetical protein
MDLFFGAFYFMVLSLLLPAVLISVVFGWMRAGRLPRTLGEVFPRPLFMGLGAGLSVCVVLAALVTWWIINHVPAPD